MSCVSQLTRKNLLFSRFMISLFIILRSNHFHFSLTLFLIENLPSLTLIIRLVPIKKQIRKNSISLTLNFLSQSLCRFAQPSPLFKTSTQPRKRKGTRRHQEFTTRRSDTSQQVCWRVEGLECSDGAGLAAAGCVCVRACLCGRLRRVKYLAFIFCSVFTGIA